MTTKAKVWGLSACVAAVLFCSLGAIAQAQVDPTGTLWDLQVTGYAVVGSGYMEFFGDGTLFGYLIIKPNMKLKPYQRPASVNIGFYFLDGEWSFDAKGRVVGFFSGGSQAIPLDISSFTATVTAPPKAKIKFAAASNNGTMHFSGVPAVALTDLTGSSWTALVQENKVKSTEFFSLAPFFFCNDNPDDPFDYDDPLVADDPLVCEDPDPPLPNLYFLTGDGASSILDGAVMINGNKRLSLVLEEFAINKDTGDPETEGNIRTVTGTINVPKRTSTMSGTDEANEGSLKSAVKMDSTFVP